MVHVSELCESTLGLRISIPYPVLHLLSNWKELVEKDPDSHHSHRLSPQAVARVGKEARVPPLTGAACSVPTFTPTPGD